MKRKILKFILIFALVTVLVSSDFILLGRGVAIAMYEELETQSVETNVKNVEFDSYFLQDGNKTHSKQSNLTQEENLILNINVKEQGVLNDAKIKIENANFEILKDKVENSYVKNINLETNEIELNEIIYQNNETIEIPIKFKKQDNFAEDYFEMENSITLTGTYKDEDEKEVLSQIKTRMMWTETVDTTLSEEIEKYIDLGENKVLLQQKVASQVIDDKLPRQSEVLNLQVPVIDEKAPNSVVVLLNGNKLADEKVKYTQETNNLEITNSTSGVWGQATNEYKVIYEYKDVTFETKTINLNTTLSTKVYTQEAIEKTHSQELEIQEKGNIVSINKAVSSSIYKGFMYANVENETTYKESNTIEISDSLSVENIQIIKDEEVFLDENVNTFDVNGALLYKTTQINKAKFLELFGTDGTITIKDGNDQELATINNGTEADEDGNITINYDDEVNYLKIETTKPVGQGEIEINHIRAMKGNTGYSKNNLKGFVNLSTKTKVKTNLSEEIAEGKTILEDTKTEAKIEISNTNLSTLQNNENVNFLVTLKSDNEQYDLYKNPEIEIVLPSELNANVKNITQLNGQDELTIVNPKLYTNDNGKQCISLELQGEQIKFENNINEGIQISITADIEIDKSVPSKAEEITMDYTNENREGETFSTTANIKLNSKYGVLIVNKLSGYNENQEVVENIENKLVTGKLDIQKEAKDATQEIAIVNNYENDITDIAIIGKLPSIDEQTINGESVKSTFEAILKQAINIEGKSAKVYYSEDVNATKDSETWKEDLEISAAKVFKVELEENKIESGNAIKISYQLQIPEGLGANQSAYTDLALSYTYAGDTATVNSSILLKTDSIKESAQALISEETENMTVEVIGTTGGEALEEGQDVYEEQKIKYIVKVTNNSEEELKNINVEVAHENAIFWEHVEYEYEDSWDGETKTATYYEEVESAELEQFKIDSILPGESKEINYQITVKEVEGEDKLLSGLLKISADDIEEKSINITENKILQGTLKLLLTEGYFEQSAVHSNGKIPVGMYVTNMGNETLTDVIVEVPLPDEMYYVADELESETEEWEFIENEDQTLKFRIPSIEPQETAFFDIQLRIKEMPIEVTQISREISFRTTVNDVTYYSNEVGRTFYQSETIITAIQTSNVEGEYISNNDEVIFTTTIQNEGVISKNIEIADELPRGVIAEEAYLLINEEKIDIDFTEEFNTINSNVFTINGGETITLVIRTKINTDYIFESSVTNYVTLTGVGIEIKTNELTYKIKEIDTDNPDDPSIPDDPTNPDDPSIPEEKKFLINGVAWIDEDKNGKRESQEELLTNLEVILVEASTGNIVTDENGNKNITKTDSEGKYEFKNLKAESYIVIFKYDNGKYRVTQYQKEGTAENSNSDVISKTINLDGQEDLAAITGTIKLEDKDIENIDAGFIKNEKFDFKLDKYISKIIIQNNKGTTVKQYDKTQLAKIELDSKQIANSTIIMEYSIQITNEGELAGYVNEIIDYMPNDLTFNSEMNKNWYQATNGELHSKELTNEIINPGETKTITLTLLKSMNKNNTGTTINTAELGKVSNDFLISDIDSTAGNKVSGEDDISTAEVIISIRTGATVMYVSLIMSIIAVIGIGVYWIKKNVLIDTNK